MAIAMAAGSGPSANGASPTAVGDAISPERESGPGEGQELLFALGRALHQAGSPSHRLEETLGRVAGRLGLSIEVFSLPTGLFLSAWRGKEATIRMFRLLPRATDLERLRLLTIEAEGLANGERPPSQSLARIEAVLAATAPARARASHAIGLFLSAASFSVFFGGGPKELWISGLIGGVVGLIALAFGGRRGESRRYELVAAMAAAFVATMVNRHLGDFIHWVPLASGLIVLLPGMALVDAIEEIANGHLASGGARMSGVGGTFLALIFGVILGVNLAGLGDHPPSDSGAVSFPTWALVPALGVVALGSVFRFQARLKDWPIILLASTVALLGARLGGRAGNPSIGPFVGALCLGLAANLYAKLHLPTPQLLLVPGLALLVPGSLGLRSLDSLVSGEPIAGIEQGFRMFMMAMALVAGLLFSNSLSRTKIRP